MMLAPNTVVIIEDEVDSCLLWKSFLSQMNFTVYTAPTLTEGLDLVERIKPAIIFLDNNLPDGLGWDHVDQIQEKVPGCRINLVSAFQFDAQRWMDKNVKVIEKPLNLSRIKALLH